MDDDLTGRVIVVTGASRGVGNGIVRHLARRGAHLAIAGRERTALEDTSAELDDLGVPHVSLNGDAASRHHAFALVAAAHERFGRVDGVVANAQASNPPAPLEQVGEDDLDVAFATGAKGTLWLMQAAFPIMKGQGRGRIVTLGSNAALDGIETFGAYSAAKEAIRALTRTAAREWGRHGITVNCVCPVSVRHHTPGLDDPETLARFERSFARNPIPRDGDLVEDVAPVVGFLLSDASAYVTGQTLMADGGRTMLR